MTPYLQPHYSHFAPPERPGPHSAVFRSSRQNGPGSSQPLQTPELRRGSLKRSQNLSRRLKLILAMSAATTMMPPTRAAAQTETVLHSFDVNGSNPNSPLIFDGSGNLYGTTQYGGDGFGTAFELSPQSGGSWKATLLHSFGLNPSDGQNPSGGLVRDAAGNLYGTTINGGADTCSSTAPKGCGTVFELSPKRAAAGARRFCTALATMVKTGSTPRLAWPSMPPASFTAQLSSAAPVQIVRRSI